MKRILGIATFALVSLAIVATPVAADERLSELLQCPPGSPLHYFEEIGLNGAGTPIIYSQEYYRPDYFSFHVIRKMATDGRP